MRRAWLASLAFTTACARLFGLDDVSPPAEASSDTAWFAVAGGDADTCAIRASDRALFCWGRNDRGLVGDATIVESDAPVAVGDSSAAWNAIEPGGDSACAIASDATLWCWGANDQGQLGVGDREDAHAPRSVGSRAWHAVSVGVDHTCALDDADALWCWGDNTNLRSGLPETMLSASAPMLVAAGPFDDVAAGTDHTCAIARADHTARCFGANDAEQCGLDLLSKPQVPDPSTAAMVPGSLVSIAAGEHFTCAIDAATHAHCWGQNDRSQLGDGTTMSPELATAFDGDSPGWATIRLGRGGGCATKTDGTAYCWGDSAHGQAGVEAPVVATPMRLGESTRRWTAVASGTTHTCAIGADGGRLWCVGRAGDGQLGDGATGSRRTPVPVTAAAHTTWGPISAGELHVCGLLPGGTLACWGGNPHGELGDGTILPHETPSIVSASATFIDVSAGPSLTCALDGNEDRWCWGGNQDQGFGADGTIATTDRPTPAKTGGTDKWQMIADGRHGCGITLGSNVKCWGPNHDHQATGDAADPVLLPTMTGGDSYTTVTVGRAHSCGVHGGKQPKVACWGAFDVGQLGVPGADGSAPVDAADAAMDQRVTASGDHTCTWSKMGFGRTCWGGNTHGEIGDGSTTNATLPVVLDAATKWLSIAAGSTFTCGVHGNGSLWCWGDNTWGQLGDGTFDAHLAPVQVGTDTDWVVVTAGLHHACAEKQDASLWCWGAANDGQIGDGGGWRFTLSPVVDP